MRSLIEDEPNVDDLEDVSALGLLQQIYRCRSISLHIRMRAAISALNYEAPRLAVTAQITDNDVATLLDQRIARYQRKLIEEQRLIEAKAVDVTNGSHKSIASTAIDAKPTNGNAHQSTAAPLARLYSNKFPRRF